MDKQVLTIRGGVKPTYSKRIDYIDLIKGIAIIGVVWSHTVHPQWYNVTYINALFFFLSGFFFKEEPFPAFLKKESQNAHYPIHFLLPPILPVPNHF